MKNFIPLVGAHISIAEGLDRAVFDASSIGATTMQIFTASYRQWTTKPLTEEQIMAFSSSMKASSLSHVMSHGSYLINLGSPHEEVRQKSINAFKKEIERCLQLNITYLNFHPGAALEAPKEVCLDAIVDALFLMKEYFSASTKLTILFENSAGQGSCVGATFEELSYLVEKVKGVLPIGVCLDTAHLFAAGYDLRSPKALDETLKAFDSIVGLQYLKAMHMNDSEEELGSHKDRHALLGQGCIGEEAFSSIMKDARLYRIPKYLETPSNLPIWQKEIAWLKSQIPSTLITEV
jgi:deoxyribonuclease IV